MLGFQSGCCSGSCDCYFEGAVGRSCFAVAASEEGRGREPSTCSARASGVHHLESPGVRKPWRTAQGPRGLSKSQTNLRSHADGLSLGWAMAQRVSKGPAPLELRLTATSCCQHEVNASCVREHEDGIEGTKTGVEVVLVSAEVTAATGIDSADVTGSIGGERRIF